jgi:DNA primase
MKYPKEYLNEIKLRLKVSQVVGKFVLLKKRGKEFIGLSPFKNEKSPSFTVNDEKEFYHCFSTSEHGNIFDFLMKTQSLGFGEAVKTLAAEAGMEPYRFSNYDEKKEKRYLNYKNIYKNYCDFFHEVLFLNENTDSLNYLKKRGLSINIIKEFKIGFVPWKNNFYKKLLENYSEEEIGLTGLYYKSDKTGKFVDRFNSRIIFPVNNLGGEVIAFGGRIIKESKLAKYINSPETEFYKKGRVIFNLDRAKSLRSQTNEIIMVEGYMDVVSLYASGIKNVVANSGTALTEGQIDLIWKFFSNPIVCLDGDESGQNAALRIAEKLFPFINESNKIFFSALPDSSDPDDYIKKYGKEKFINFLNEKQIIQTYIWNIHSNRINKNDPYAISKFEKDMKKISYSIKDEVLRKHILEDFLEKIKELTPIQNIKKIFKPYQNFKQKNDFQILKATTNLYKQKNHLTKEQIKEYSLLFLMIYHTESALLKIEDLAATEFSSEITNNLKNEIIDYLSKGFDSHNIILKIKDEFKALVNEIQKNSNLKNIINKKNNEEKVEFIDELLQDMKLMNQLKKIEYLERKVANNLDENSYSELIRLKNQLNSD